MYVPTAKAAAKIDGRKNRPMRISSLIWKRHIWRRSKRQLAPSANILKLDYVDDAKTKDDRYVIWNRQAGSIIVNHSVLDKHDRQRRILEDTLDPSYRGLIAMPDP